MRRSFMIFALAALCGLMSARASWSAEGALLRANYAGISAGFVPVWIALDRGLFAKYGLNVDLQFISPATATQGLLAKSLDIVNPGGEIVEAALSGEPVVYMAGVLNRAVLSIYSKPEIKSLADLKGKTIAVTVPGSTTDFAARIMLQQVGLTAGKDVKILFLKGQAQILQGVQQGHAEAGIFSSPTTLKAGHAGLKELVNITEKNVPMIHAAFASTKEYMKTQRDQVRRFLQGYIEGIKIARGEPELAKQIIGRYTKTDDKQDLDDSYKTNVTAWERAPYVSVPAVQTMLDFATHPAGKTAKPEQMIDNSVIAELEKSGFIDRLYK